MIMSSSSLFNCKKVITMAESDIKLDFKSNSNNTMHQNSGCCMNYHQIINRYDKALTDLASCSQGSLHASGNVRRFMPLNFV